MYKIAIFDLDGTLLNTLDDLAIACNFALRENGLSPHSTDEYKLFVGGGRLNLIKNIIPKHLHSEELISKVLGSFDDYYSNHMMDKTRPYDGIPQLLVDLKALGISTAVVSNKPHEFTIEVAKKYFGDALDIVYGQRKGHAVKPDPSTVLEVLNNFNASTTECIYIGDSGVDMKTATNANVASVGVLWGYRSKEELVSAGADSLAKNVEELKKLII